MIKAQSVLSRITVSSDRPIEILDWMDARFARLISDEHPQIISLVISYLEFGLAADVLGLLPHSYNQISSENCNFTDGSALTH